MRIQEIRQKIKSWLMHETFFTAILVVAVAAVSFGLGRISAEDKNVVQGMRTENAEKFEARLSVQAQSESAQQSEAPKGLNQGAYVGSKNSNKYHLPWCSGAKTISESNKVWFGSKQEAESAGYIPAANCKGI